LTAQNKAQIAGEWLFLTNHDTLIHATIFNTFAGKKKRSASTINEDSLQTQLKRHKRITCIAFAIAINKGSNR